MIGTTLDKYEVLQKVGEGGMATVYRGRHSTLNRDVAIKVLHPHLSSSQRNRKRFAREARAIEQLRHDNILEIFDYSGLEASDCYIVTEFVEGDTLTALLQRRGRLDSEVVALVGVHITRALGYAHRQGILHRDLKTDNVMVRIDGTVKLMDFGIARFLDESQVTMTGALVGSPAFMSPEQAREGTLDLRSDLFALGTMMFYLVTGHLPFSGSNPSLILKNVIEGNRPNVTELAPTMSASLADVIERLMATDPEDRQNTAEEVERQLLACLAEARIDPTSDAWCLRTWLDDPEAYDTRLEEHLKTVLVEEGRRLLGEGDHLAALRLFNRLLSMDEENAEVLSLVQGLHQGDLATATRRSAWIAGGALVAVVLGLLGLWTMSQRQGLTPTPVPDVQPLTAVAAPTPTPVLAPVPDVVPAEPDPAPSAPPRVEAPQPRIVPPRPVRPPPEPEPPPPADEPATVVINTRKYTADVYLRGTKLGETRTALPIPAGVQELTIKSPTGLFETHTESITIAPGERKTILVDLHLIPSAIVFPQSWDAACRVVANGADRGTIADLGRRLPVPAPDERLDVRVECEGGVSKSRRFENVLPPDATFPEAPAP